MAVRRKAGSKGKSKAAAKKSGRKPAAGKAPRKPAVKRRPAKSAAAKKTRAARKTTPRTAASKTPAAKTAASKKTASKKAVPKKAASKKAALKKPASKRTAAQKAPARKTGRKGSSKTTSARTASVKKPAARTASAKKVATKKVAAKKVAAKVAALRKPAAKPAGSRTAAAKAGRAATRPPAKTAETSKRVRSPQAQAASPPLASAAASARKPARKAARRVAPVRVAEPRKAGVRKVGVRTAVQQETSRAPRPETGRKPGKAALADLVRIQAPQVDGQEAVLTAEALEFLALLHRQFDGRRLSLLARRHERQARFDAGEWPDFLHETRHVRSSGWRVTGLADHWFASQTEAVVRPARDSLAAALAFGATSLVADFEDAAPPTWANVIAGQAALLDHWSRQDAPGTGDLRRLAVRPRGWHLPEAHVTLDGGALSASLFDAGLALFHTARRQVALGFGPSLCLPKLESYLEARLWSDVLTFAERHLGLPRGTCKVVVDVETLPAVFEMDEIVFELREHIAGLNFVSRGLIFSLLKRLGGHARFLMPDRAEIAADRGFLAAIAALLVQTCRRRGIAALGDLPTPAGSEADETPAAAALLEVPPGRRTRDGLQASTGLAVRHLADWLVGGADESFAAEAEVARALVWQALRQGAVFEDATVATADWLASALEAESESLAGHPQATVATQLFLEVSTAPDCEERLSLLVYRLLVERGL